MVSVWLNLWEIKITLPPGNRKFPVLGGVRIILYLSSKLCCNQLNMRQYSLHINPDEPLYPTRSIRSLRQSMYD